jgi:hypothetical protein
VRVGGRAPRGGAVMLSYSFCLTSNPAHRSTQDES